MNDLPLLLLLFALGRAKCSTTTPTWPTPASPPPPPPPEPPLPLRAQPPPAPWRKTPEPVAPPVDPGGGDFGGGGADNVPNIPTDAGPPSDAGKPSWSDLLAPSKAKAQATKAAKRLTVKAPRVGPPAPHMSDVSVANIQTALIKRGAKLVKDGLYGPKTVAAWSAIASRNKLSPMISRRTGKIARVPTSTYAALAGPVIP